MDTNNNEEVKEPTEAVETPPTNSVEDESAQAVKTEEPKVESQPEVTKSVDSTKLEEQIGNLNKALAQERDSKKQNAEKVAQLEQRLEESQDVMDRMKNVFVPEEEEQLQETYGLDEDRLIQILNERDEKSKQEKIEQERSTLIQNEIKELSEKYNGEDGNLKYDDNKVLEWQKQSNKLYLTPKEAFSAMNQKEIIDYEVKQALAGKKTVDNVEQPSSAPAQHEPAETIPKNDMETRQAVEEAMNNIGQDI